MACLVWLVVSTIVLINLGAPSNAGGNEPAELHHKPVASTSDPCLTHITSTRPRNMTSITCSMHLGPTTPQCCCSISSTAPNVTGGRDGSTSAQMEHEPGASPSPPRLVCLPSFMVIGAQKSGSTALFAYFLTHPQFKAPNRKECHIFDFPGTSSKAPWQQLTHYLGLLPDIQPPHTRHYLTGETTPSYLLGSQTAEAIHAWLPNVRLIAVLRNPVDRAYSEYQMKLRRVEAQFSENNTDHHTDLMRAILPCYHNPYVPLHFTE